jgi:Icc-related predicted phosphoesterase
MSIEGRYVGKRSEGDRMRFLAFSDIHGDLNRVRTLLSTDVDLFLCAGDVANGSRDLFIEFSRIVGRKHLLMVPGNNERPEWIPNYMNLHGERKQFMGIVFGGLGGSPPTPFNTVFEWEEDYAYEVLERIGYVDVFLSHTPPKGTKLSYTYSGLDVGSEAVRWYIEEYVPRIAVVGHVHEREGMTDKVLSTPLVNPGKKGVIVEVNQAGEPRILWL